MPSMSQEHKHRALVQLRSDVSTHKVVTIVGMSQSSIVHMRKDIRGEIERQRRGRPKLLANREKRHCVTLVTQGWLGSAFATTNNFDVKHVNCCLTTLWGALWELLDWVHKCNKGSQFWVANMFLYSRGFFKGMRIGPLMIGNAYFLVTRQKIQTVKHGRGLSDDLGMHDGFCARNIVHNWR